MDSTDEYLRRHKPLLSAIGKIIKNDVLPRIEKLEKQMQTKGLDYKGTFTQGAVYNRNDCATFQGSLWVSLVDANKSSPGSGGHWMLAVKSGRDGKDLR